MSINKIKTAFVKQDVRTAGRFDRALRKAESSVLFLYAVLILQERCSCRPGSENPADHTHILCHLNCINVISNLLAGRRERLECVGCTTDELWLWVLSFFCHATPSYLSLPSLTEPTPSYPVCEDEVGKVGWDGSGSQCRMGLDEVGWSRMR